MQNPQIVRQPTIRRDNRIAKIIAIVCGVTLPIAALAGYGYWWWSGQPDREVANACSGASGKRLGQVLTGAKLSSSSPEPDSSALGYECTVIDIPKDNTLKQGYISTYRIDSRNQEQWAKGAFRDRCDDIAAADNRLPESSFTLPDADEFCTATSKADVSIYTNDDDRYGVDTEIAARHGLDVIRISYSEDPGHPSEVSEEAQKIATTVVQALEDVGS